MSVAVVDLVATRARRSRYQRGIIFRMAMTLRLTDEETEALRRRAEQLGKSMQSVARDAIRYATMERPNRLQNAIETVAADDAELLDRLAQ